ISLPLIIMSGVHLALLLHCIAESGCFFIGPFRDETLVYNSQHIIPANLHFFPIAQTPAVNFVGSSPRDASKTTDCQYQLLFLSAKFRGQNLWVKNQNLIFVTEIVIIRTTGFLTKWDTIRFSGCPFFP